jgi:hypothetical protein
MNRFSMFATAALMALSLGLPAGAEGTVDPAMQEKLTAQLVKEGYEVRKVQMEDGLLEAYAVKDGKTHEMYFDKDLKEVKKN